MNLDLVLQVICGLVAGLLAARAHLHLSERAAKHAVESGRAIAALVGFPLRVAAIAGALFLLSRWGLWALGAGLVGFAAGEITGLRAPTKREGAKEA